MKKFLYIFFVLLITATTVFAENISQMKLPDGQSVIIKEIHTNPIVIIDTWVRTGSIDETDKNNGTAHFLEHLFFKGSKNFPSNEFDKLAESKGAETNAATSKDYTHFYIKIPSKDFETAVKLQADMLLNPAIPQNELDKERLVVIREIERSNDNPQRVLYNNFNRELYKIHPYKREVLGTKNIISTIPRDEIIDFYKTNYVPENMVTVIVGDVDTQKAYQLVKKYFARDYKTEKPKQRNYKQDKKPENQKIVKSQEDVSSSYLMIGYKCNSKISDKDSYALDLLSVILGGGKSSALYTDIKDQKQLAQSIYAGHSSYAEDSIFYITANYDEKNYDKLKSEIFNVVEKYRSSAPTQSELDKAKKMLERETLYSRESVSDFASEIGYSTTITGDSKFYENYLKNLNKITAKDIQKVAKKYLEPEHTVISVVLPKNQNCDKNSQTVLSEKSPETVKNITPDKYINPKHHKCYRHDTIGKHDKYFLDNKAVMISDKHKENQIIAISIKVKGGDYTDKIKGLSKITTQMMLAGTKKYPKEVFNSIKEANGIVISPSSDTETYTLSMKFTKQDLPLAMEFLNQIVNEPNFDKTELEKIKTNSLAEIARSKDYGASVGTDLLYKNIWQNSPFYVSYADLEKNIPTISVNDVKNNHKAFFEPKNMVIAVNGDVSDKEMINYFSEIFKSNPENKVVNYSDYKNLLKPVEESKTVIDYKGKESAWIFMGWQTDGIVNLKDRATLSVINAILGNGMSSRLFSEVRAQKGLAYAIGSSIPANTANGVFTIYIGTAPDRVNEAVSAISDEVEKLKKEFVSDKELQDAKDKLKGQVVLSLETNLEKANSTAATEINGRGCDFFFDRFNALVDSVTVSDIITTANKYFSKPYITAEILPKK